ncbi:EmrB/QacA family drug resistance transporter [Pseudomonas aeruginosa]|nr:EmrB/QacA family drug resistance transporter [Pseudomonas aeruginosa]
MLLIAAIAWAISPQAMQLQRLRQGDWLGIASMIVGLGAIQIVLEEGGRKDWFGSDFIVLDLVLGVAALLLFIYTQLFGRRSFINLRLLAGYNFGVASAAMFIFGGATFGLVFPGAELPVATARLQRPRDRRQPDRLRPRATAAGAGDAAPDALAASQADGRHGLRHHGRRLLHRRYLDADSAANVIIPSTVVRGIGQPFIMVALSVLAVSGLSKSEAGSASALFSMLRNLGGAVGTAVLTQVVSQRERLPLGPHRGTGECLLPGPAGAPPGRSRPGQRLRHQRMAAGQAETLARLGAHIRHESFLMAYGDAFYLSFIALLSGAARHSPCVVGKAPDRRRIRHPVFKERQTEGVIFRQGRKTNKNGFIP